MATIKADILAGGAYTTAQAALIAEVANTSKVRRWLFGSKSGASALLPYYGPDQRLVSFYDLVQLMAIRDIRTHNEVSLGKIREAIDTAKRYGIEYPFARRHQTYVFDGDVVLRVGDRVIAATGKYKHDDLIKPVAEWYMKDIGFDDQGLAQEYTPMRDGDRRVSLSPKRRYGAPVVFPSRYAVDTLVCAVESEGSVVRAARAFEVDEAEVRLALRYEQQLRKAA